MKKRYCSYAIFLLLIWVFAAHQPGTCQHLHSSYWVSRKGSVEEDITDSEKRVSQVGSKPPKCEHKCGTCEPCIAIQVPTTTQSANYQPESWKCHCLISIETPIV